MDGSYTQSFCRLFCWRGSQGRSPLVYVSACAVLCSAFAARPGEGIAADPSGLFRKWSNKPATNATSKADDSRSREITQTSMVAADETTVTGQNTPPGRMSANVPLADVKTDLQRFPQKRVIARPTFQDPVDRIGNVREEDEVPIDLPGALRLAGVSSPQVLLVQQRVLAATAQQQLAAAQALPNLNFGTNYDQHTGALQRASGKIIDVSRNALYVGAGGNAVAAGTTNLPGLLYNLNVGDSYFDYLISRQLSERSRAGAAATRNNTLLQTAITYCQLVRSQGGRAIAVKIRDDAAELARINASFAKIGQARPADAERAANELELRQADIYLHDAAIAQASSRLVEVLNLESSVRLRSNENWIVPRPVVPDLIPLPELIAISLYQRPEVAAHRADVHAAFLDLSNAKLLLFSPQVIAGFSDGAFGGGSNINAQNTGSPRFGDFANRTDEDLVLYWSIRNLGLGNKALIKMATARLAVANLEQTKRFNEIRAQVADAYARTQSSAAQLEIRQRAVATSERGYRADLERARAGEGLPIEVLNSLMLLSRAQVAYLNAISDYNQAQYELYVAIGQPPADLLIRTTETPTPTEAP